MDRPARVAAVEHALERRALDVDRAPLEGVFDGHAARRAIHPHVLASAVFSGTYTLNPRVLAHGA